MSDLKNDEIIFGNDDFKWDDWEELDQEEINNLEEI